MEENLETRYPLAETTFADEEINAARAALDSGRLTMGRLVRQFETEFANWTGARHAVMVNSGSSANLLIIDALLRRSGIKPPLKPGDEILIPALAWPTTAWPIIQLGLTPVFVDVNPETLSMDVKNIEAAISNKTRAVFVVHVMGQMTDMTALTDFCRKKGLILIEDCCESLGSHQNGIHAGNFGEMGSFSCYFSHHISTIEGGFITTNDEALYNDLLSLRSHGWTRNRLDESDWKEKYPDIDPRFLFVTSGYNVRPTEIQAAIGLVQIKKLDEMIDLRIQLAQKIHQLIRQHTPWMSLIGADKLPASNMGTKRKERQHSWMTLPMLIQEGHPHTVLDVKNHFERKGIETRPIIAGNLSRHPGFRHVSFRKAPSLRVADAIFKNGFMVGCHPYDWPGHIRRFQEAFESLATRTTIDTSVS